MPTRDYSGFTDEQLRAKLTRKRQAHYRKYNDESIIFYDATNDIREIEGIERVLRNRAAFEADTVRRGVKA